MYVCMYVCTYVYLYVYITKSNHISIISFLNQAEIAVATGSNSKFEKKRGPLFDMNNAITVALFAVGCHFVG